MRKILYELGLLIYGILLILRSINVITWYGWDYVLLYIPLSIVACIGIFLGIIGLIAILITKRED